MGLKLKIKQGSTFTKQLRWEAEPYNYRPIVAISSSAPCELHVPAHGLLADQLFMVQDAQGLTDLNASDPNSLVGWFRATVIDQDHIQINKVNARGMKPHTPNTGTIKYRTLVDLTGYTARMFIRNKLGGDILHEMSSDPAGGITIDTVNGFITLTISAIDTELFDWKKGVYDLDLTSPGGIVTTILGGDVTVDREVTPS